MAHRLISWITGILRDADGEAQPHFHQGPESLPAVCYDEDCRSPRLDVGDGG